MGQQVQSIAKVPDAVNTSMTSVACLLDTPEPMVSIQTPQPMSLAALEPVRMATVDAEKMETPRLRSVANITHRSARFVAGVRLPRSPRAGRSTNPRTTRSARRAVGARLVAKLQHQEVPDVSFDSSRVRTQIQAGLRSASRVFSEDAKEHKSLAESAGGQSEHMLYIFSLRLMDDDYMKTYPSTCQRP